MEKNINKKFNKSINLKFENRYRDSNFMLKSSLMHIFKTKWKFSLRSRLHLFDANRVFPTAAQPAYNHINNFMSLQRSVNIEHKRHSINTFYTGLSLSTLTTTLSHITLYFHLNHPLAVLIILIPLFNGSKWKKYEEEENSNSACLSACCTILSSFVSVACKIQ